MKEQTPETWVPPPPRAASTPSGERGEHLAARTPEWPAAPGRPACRPFQAEADCSELDDRDRPGATWVAHAAAISRSSIVLRSRRMCYVGRRVLIAVHLIDDRPTALFGRVVSCEYDSEGIHVLDLDLLPLPAGAPIRAWLNDRG